MDLIASAWETTNTVPLACAARIFSSSPINRPCISLNDSPPGMRVCVGRCWMSFHSRERAACLTDRPVNCRDGHLSVRYIPMLSTSKLSQESRPPSPTERIHSGVSRRWLLLVLCFVAFALRLFDLDYQSLWYDEGFSWWLSAQPLDQIIARTASDIHPPFYYVALHE